MPTMWTPDRDVPLHTKSTESMRPDEMKVVELMHVVAQKFGIQLICLKCKYPFQGLNSGHGRTQSIFCQCREIKAETGRSIVISPSGGF